MSEFNFNHHCEKLLVEYKRRNTERVAKRLDVICQSLRKAGHHAVQTKFGGSVTKGTYVSGLSDVDALLIVNQTSLVNQPPSKVITYVQEVVQQRLRQNPVSGGKMAVTVGYSDGMEMQLLPAIRTKSGGVRIAEPGGSKWSNVVIPDAFPKRLTKINDANHGRVVPVIKLAKAMADCFISRESNKISGYHMESLAVDAFSDYEGKPDPKSVLIHLLGHSISAVLSPITDPTGQTTYVDQYLGPADSQVRKGASTHFGQMRGEVKRCQTRGQFNKLFCIDN